MKLSELIAEYGDDKVLCQKLDDCTSSMNMTPKGTKITFVTPERLSLDGLDKLGLVIWFDRDQVAALLTGNASSETEGGR